MKQLLTARLGGKTASGPHACRPARLVALVRKMVLLPLLAAVCLGAMATQAYAATVTFADANLETAVRATLGISQPLPVTDTDMMGLWSLNAQGMGVSNLDGLQYAGNLRNLNIADNPVSDLTPILGIPYVLQLDMSNTQVSDLSALSGFDYISQLRARNDNITDISPLASLPTLVTLDLSANPISDISPLAGLAGLTHLWINDAQLSDISPLAGLAGLQHLHLVRNQISDISPLAGLTSLTYLELVGNQITDVSAVSPLTQLTYLDLGGNPLSDISPLSTLTNLVILALNSDNISDISPLAGLTNLGSLFLSQNRISDLSPLAGMANLTYLELNGNRVSDISPLASLGKLYVAWLTSNLITDLSPVVDSPGAGYARHFHVEYNYLDLTAGSAAMGQINALLARGDTVSYVPQNAFPNTTITSTPSSANGASGWYLSAPAIVLSSDKPGTTNFAWDGAASEVYSAPLNAPEGVHTLSAVSIDTNGMTGPTVTRTFSVDTIAPTAPVLSAASVSTDTVGLYWTASAESGSGLLQYTVFVNGSIVATTTAAHFTVHGLTPDTTYSFHVEATDVAGNTAADGDVLTVTTAPILQADTTAPTTTMSAAPATNASGWNTSDVVVTLSATDNQGGSGVAATHYTLDGTQHVYTAPVSISAEGVHALTYWSVDSAGNAEASHSATVRIDKTAPVLNITTPASTGTYYLRQSVAANWTATDALSGIASANGTAPNGGALDTSVAGTRTFTVTATDNAGNTTSKSVTYVVIAPSQLFTDLLAFFDAGVANRTLRGTGCWPSASLSTFRAKLVSASNYYNSYVRTGNTCYLSAAISGLHNAYAYCDGAGCPTDLVTGTGRPALATRILTLKGVLAYQ